VSRDDRFTIASQIPLPTDPVRAVVDEGRVRERLLLRMEATRSDVLRAQASCAAGHARSTRRRIAAARRSLVTAVTKIRTGQALANVTTELLPRLDALSSDLRAARRAPTCW
jgi:hypothetical protein